MKKRNDSILCIYGKRDDVYKNRGLHEYGDVEFADNVNKNILLILLNI